MKSVIRKIIFSLVMALTGVQAYCEPTYFDLERTAANSLKAELRPLLDGFLLKRIGHPDHPYQLDTAIDIRSGSIQSAHVRFTADFPMDTPLALDLEAYISNFFSERGYRTSEVLLGPRKPLVKVEIAAGELSAIPEAISILTKLLFAIFCLIIIRSLYRQTTPKHRQKSEAEGAKGDFYGESLAARFPKDALEDKSLTISPKEGSWYIKSLVDLPAGRLSDAFRSIPMSEALTLLNNVPAGPYRDHVISKLNLRVPLRNQLESIQKVRKS